MRHFVLLSFIFILRPTACGDFRLYSTKQQQTINANIAVQVMVAFREALSYGYRRKERVAYVPLIYPSKGSRGETNDQSLQDKAFFFGIDTDKEGRVQRQWGE
jgi:hypothetical protein